MIFFQVVGFLDVSRMWMKMYSSALAGQSNHKSTDYAILRFYYSEVCVICELFIYSTCAIRNCTYFTVYYVVENRCDNANYFWFKNVIM